MKNNLKATPILLLTAMIWGFAFVAQRVGASFLGAFSFNGVRFALGAVSLIPVILIFDRTKTDKAERRQLLIASAVGGTVLFLASVLQQWGIEFTGSAGKSGFMTGLYMVLVPVIGFLFLRRKTNVFVWIGVLCALAGLYLLTIGGSVEKPGLGDIALITGAVFWALHILVVDSYTAKGISVLKFAGGQFVVCAILNLICALCFEDLTWAGVQGAAVPILYGGIMSVGVAYTLQIIGQKHSEPAYASIVLSLESMFSAIGGAIILKERMTAGGYVGCVLMFAGIMLAQADDLRKKKE